MILGILDGKHHHELQHAGDSGFDDGGGLDDGGGFDPASERWLELTVYCEPNDADDVRTRTRVTHVVGGRSRCYP